MQEQETKLADIAVLIPAFNEAGNIAAVLQKVPSTIRGLPVRPIVISDGSTDRTDSVAKDCGAWVVRHSTNYGQGMALQTGYRCATALGATYAVTLDADGQYSPAEIERLLTPLLENRADIVSGSRMLGYYEQEFAENHRIRSFGVHFLICFSRYSRVRASPIAPAAFGQSEFPSSVA